MAKDEINAAENITEETKEIRPRKRLITKNIQLRVSFGIFLAAIMTIIVWKLFLDQNIIGAWHEQYSDSYIETLENAETIDSPDVVEEKTVDYTQQLVYEFTQDGVCTVRFGSVSVDGTYEIAATKENGNVLSAEVFYDYSPVFYGIFKYKVTGNVFTGRKLVLEEITGDDTQTSEESAEKKEPQILDYGAGEEPVQVFENFENDERLLGKWYDSANEITYEFRDDGYMIRSTTDGLSMKHAYNVPQTGAIVLKFAIESEESYTVTYEFKDGKLYIDDNETTRMDE